MDATTKTALVIAFVVVALLLLLFGGGMVTGTMMSGGMMREREHGRNQLDVASYLACRRARHRAFLGHIRKEVR